MYATIILAGGKGTRMGVPNKHKCAFEIGGVPTIYRLLDGFERNRTPVKVIVLGSLSEQMMQLVSQKYDNVIFVFQPEQKGTGNAAKYGVNALASVCFDGGIFIIAGDTYIEESAIQKLLKTFEENDLDLAFLVKDKNSAPTWGHIITDENGEILANKEYWDLMKVSLAKELQNSVQILKNQIALETLAKKEGKIKTFFSTTHPYLMEKFGSEKKYRLIFPEIFKYLETVSNINTLTPPSDTAQLFLALENMVQQLPKTITIEGRNYDPDELKESCRFVNISVYLFRAHSLFSLIGEIKSDNAQNEEYLTDLIEIFRGAKCKIQAVPIDFNEQVMAFNDPAQLEDINKHVLEKK